MLGPWKLIRSYHLQSARPCNRMTACGYKATRWNGPSHIRLRRRKQTIESIAASHNDLFAGNVRFAIRKRTFASVNLNGRNGSASDRGCNNELLLLSLMKGALQCAIHHASSLCSQVFLQRLDRAGDGGLRHVEIDGSRGHLSELRGSDEIANLPERKSHFPCLLIRLTTRLKGRSSPLTRYKKTNIRTPFFIFYNKPHWSNNLKSNYFSRRFTA